MARNEKKKNEQTTETTVIESRNEAKDELEIKEIAVALAAPFEATEVKFKPQTVSGNRALPVAYVDARVVQDRLDDVLGVMGWQDSYECLPDGSVVCRLMIRLGEEWITKMDVGGQSEQPDEGDRRKAAFSDALKRAAVKFGIGRYLYRVKMDWVDYDPQKRRFVKQPTLPGMPAPTIPAAPKPALVRVEDKPTPGKPNNGKELQRRLAERDQELSKQGICKPGELLEHVMNAGQKAGYERDLATWTGPAIDLAVTEVKAFLGRRRQAA